MEKEGGQEERVVGFRRRKKQYLGTHLKCIYCLSKTEVQLGIVYLMCHTTNEGCGKGDREAGQGRKRDPLSWKMTAAPACGWRMSWCPWEVMVQHAGQAGLTLVP